MKIYLPIAKVDAERREVWGYASTEARDEDGEIVKREALIAALGDYMKFANIREMHQLSAVGVAREATVDDKGLYIGAKIVDDHAWQKVVEGVYKGYSIGGRVTQRDVLDHQTITGLVLNEISLVDRPANPEAVFDYWKATGVSRMSQARFNPPIQIWACGVPEHRHLAKAEAMRCQEQIKASTVEVVSTERTTAKDQPKGGGRAGEQIRRGELEYADRGYQADGKKRYPIDTEAHIRAAWNFINRQRNAQRYTPAQLDEIKSRIIAAWKERIDENGPAAAEEGMKAGQRSTRFALTKALWDVGHTARILLDLQWLRQQLTTEAEMDADESSEQSRLWTSIAELVSCLNSLAAEETNEILDEAETIDEPGAMQAADIVIMAGGANGATLLADLYRGKSVKLEKLSRIILAKAQHSEQDQALLDLAYHAVDKCMGLDALLFTERSHIDKARAALQAAGAVPCEEGREASTTRPMVRQLGTECCPTENSSGNPSSLLIADAGTNALEMIAAALGKRGQGHQALVDVAHDCIGKLTDNGCCLAAKAGARHSKAVLGHLIAAHNHLVAAGAKCAAADFTPETEQNEAGFERGRTTARNLVKLLAQERAENTTLITTLREIMPRLDQLTKRVEDIARTPLPPLTIAKNVASISKREDAERSGLSLDDLAGTFARMSREEQTLTLIKASHARPIHPPGLAPVKGVDGD